MKLKRSRLLFLISVFISSIATAQEAAVERFALYIGENNGGESREVLRYAESDAASLERTMREIGGVKQENECLLLGPSITQIDEQLSLFSQKIATVQLQSKRTEFIFYYSGHSEEDGLLIGESKYRYADLKETLDGMPGDVHIVLLDSCYSGNFMRTKGGTKQKPFLVDDSTVVTGHAYLSSSSATEQSQESDVIKGSYFTSSLVTGLRGAADSSGDKKVSLNELYYYAFNNTLSATERSKVGPQHPGYNVTLVGSGDMVLTDIGSAEAVLVIAADVTGTIIVRHADGALASELIKKPGKSVVLALPAGTYQATVVGAKETRDSYFILAKDKVYTLDTNGLASVTYIEGRTRGGKAIAEFADVPDKAANSPFKLGVAGLLQFPKYPVYPVAFAMNLLNGTDAGISGVQCNLFYGAIKGKLLGAQFNTLTGSITGVTKGVQFAGMLNTAYGLFSGVQLSPVANYSTGVHTGAQIGGIFNEAQTLNGIQVGLFNYVDELNGVSLGLCSYVGNGIHSPGITFDSDKVLSILYKGGMPYCYNVLSLGKKLDSTDMSFVISYGLGTSYTIQNATVSFEAICKCHYDGTFAFIPEARSSLTVRLLDHFALVLGAGLDFDIHNASADYFNTVSRVYSLADGDGLQVRLHPVYSFGILF